MRTNFYFVTALLLVACRQMNFAADTDLAKLAVANNTFAFKLLQQVASENKGGNIFISPYSAATALQMAANGAAGQTRAEMQQVLETSGLSTTGLNAASQAAAGLLVSQDTNLVLTTANALWYRRGAAIKPEFLAANRQFFSSTVRALDFGQPQAAEAEINQWAGDQTHGRITDIANGMITPYADLILANAIYFKGRWADPFDAKLTKERPFHPADGAEKNLPMMAKSRRFDHLKAPGYEAVRLPYVGGNLAMYVFLPDPGSSPVKLLPAMNGDDWRQVMLPGFTGQEGVVVLPRFKLENTFELKSPLEALGMKTAFVGGQANFSGMFSDPHSISEIRQKTFVEVKEEGTEAAAVTVIGMRSNAILLNRAEPFQMVMDRPFLFSIVDARSGMILFLGIVNDL